jgi:hypothetical protein
MKKITGRIAGFLFAAALLLVFGVGRAEAQTVWWPYSDADYYCYWQLPDPAHPGQVITGTSIDRFANLQGNNYLRRGYLQITYPSGAFSETSVTITKPVNNCGAGCTSFELTTGTGVQCKDFRSFNNSTALSFAQCSNGALQLCVLL